MKDATHVGRRKALNDDDRRHAFAWLAVRELAARTQMEHERLDVLLNNAALGDRSGPACQRDGHEATFQVDYVAPYMLGYLM